VFFVYFYFHLLLFVNSIAKLFPFYNTTNVFLSLFMSFWLLKLLYFACAFHYRGGVFLFCGWLWENKNAFLIVKSRRHFYRKCLLFFLSVVLV
jgi:hypothetical protein